MARPLTCVVRCRSIGGQGTAPLALALERPYFAGSGSISVGSQRWPKAGSLYGVGGRCHVPVAGGLTVASTCTSMRKGRLAATACSRAPLKSSDLVMVMASTPLALAQPAKLGL